VGTGVWDVVIRYKNYAVIAVIGCYEQIRAKKITPAIMQG